MGAAQPLILNVDDYEPGRYALTRILEKADFRVTEAATGGDALRLTRVECPDLVLLDVNLPDMNGFEVCRRIKADPATARIPVLHISASSLQTADRARGLDSGADSYLTEPVEPEVLVATIRATLRARSAEDSVRELARQWQTIFDAIGHGIALLNAGGGIVRWNRTLERLITTPPAELQAFYELWPPEAGEPQRAAFGRAMASGERQEFVVRERERWLQVTVDPLMAERGSGAVYMVDDITGRKHLEEQFREAQKYESIGQLAGGVAHDFNNLLTAVLGNASLLLADLPAGHPFRDKVEEILTAGNRAAHLTQQLLAYSGRGRFVMRNVDLSRMVAGIGDLLRASLPRKVDIRFDLMPSPPRVAADPAQLQQLLMNLTINAGEAIGDSHGLVTIATAAREDRVVLEVRDTGHGIPPEIKPQIFDPFFSTKFTGRGLGLAAVAGIVRGHDGEIEVTSEPGRGTTFRVLLPAVRSTGTAASSPLVLVVDDEELVRRVAKAALEIRGYRVMVVENGREAVEAVRTRGHEIAVVLLDLTMPVMSGEEAMSEIMRVAPGLKVIGSSGHSQDEARRRFAGTGVAGFLQKPYTSRELAQKIEAALE